jgi:acyl carrier protein
MENKIKYNTAFTESFGIDESALDDLEYESIMEWDSVGHMGLIAEIEEAFDIELEMDDVIDFSSYDKGKEILKKHNIEI